MRKFRVGRDWLSCKELAEYVGVVPQSINAWINAGVYEERMLKHFGYAPIIRDHRDIIRDSMERYYVLYEVNQSYRYGIAVGYGTDEREAIKNFLDSRSLSVLKFRPLIVTKNIKTAQKMLQGKINESRKEMTG